MKAAFVVILALCAPVADAASLVDPKGPGQVEENKGAACAECQSKAEYLDKKDPCVCFASDIWGTFANDATKTLTTREKYGMKTEQIGADRLAEGWVWHCRPISATQGVWQQC